MAGGDRSSRAGEIRAPGELRELAAIAASAADSLARGFETAEVTLDRQLAPAPVLADERWLHWRSRERVRWRVFGDAEISGTLADCVQWHYN